MDAYLRISLFAHLPICVFKVPVCAYLHFPVTGNAILLFDVDFTQIAFAWKRASSAFHGNAGFVANRN